MQVIQSLKQSTIDCGYELFAVVIWIPFVAKYQVDWTLTQNRYFNVSSDAKYVFKWCHDVNGACVANLNTQNSELWWYHDKTKVFAFGKYCVAILPPQLMRIYGDCWQLWCVLDLCSNARDARTVVHVGIANLRWQGKRSRHSRRMRKLHFYVSGSRLIEDYWARHPTPYNMLLNDNPAAKLTCEMLPKRA